MAAGLLSLAAVQAANAGSIPYPDTFTENPVLYDFTAASNGDIVAYFYGTNAAYNSTLGLLVNGVDTGITGLPNHGSAIGQSLNFGFVTAGSVLTFYIKILETDFTFFSDKAMNADGENHIYSTTFFGSNVIPAGTYVGFEDLSVKLLCNSDFNYTDHQFVFTNTIAAVPEPSTWAMLIAGFAGLGAMAYRRSRKDREALATA